MGLNCLKVAEPLLGDSLLFTAKSPGVPYTFDRPRKDERLSRPWIHPVVLNPGPLSWEPSALMQHLNTTLLVLTNSLC